MPTTNSLATVALPRAGHEPALFLWALAFTRRWNARQQPRQRLRTIAWPRALLRQTPSLSYATHRPQLLVRQSLIPIHVATNRNTQ